MEKTCVFFAFLCNPIGSRRYLIDETPSGRQKIPHPLRKKKTEHAAVTFKRPSTPHIFFVRRTARGRRPMRVGGGVASSICHSHLQKKERGGGRSKCERDVGGEGGAARERARERERERDRGLCGFPWRVKSVRKQAAPPSFCLCVCVYVCVCEWK